MLAAACRLEVLDLSGLPGLQVSLGDVRCTLARMPRLSLLLLGKQAACPGMPPGGPPGLEWRTPSVAALVALGQALPHLQVRGCPGCCGGGGACTAGGSECRDATGGPLTAPVAPAACQRTGWALHPRSVCHSNPPCPCSPVSKQVDFEHTAAEFEGI